MYILVIWTVISTAGTQFSVTEKMGWQPISEFNNLKACQTAGSELGKKPESFRCLKKD